MYFKNGTTMKKKKQKPILLLGAHMSIAGGLDKAIDRAEEIGCTVMQIFSKSNRQWYARELSQEEVDQFKKRRADSAIQSVVVHASYLINLAAPNPEIRKKSRDALHEELHRADRLAVDYLIFHPGSYGNTDEQKGLQHIIDNLNDILANYDGNTILLLETMAGQGSNLGYTFDQIAHIYNNIKRKEYVGVGLDTAHVFAAGYDLRDKHSYEKTLQIFDGIIGLNLLKMIHINDSKKELGSRVDRHEDIGKGKLGLEPFRLLFNDERFFAIPKILETPKESLADDARNLQTIKNLISEETKKKLNLKGE